MKTTTLSGWLKGKNLELKQYQQQQSYVNDTTTTLWIQKLEKLKKLPQISVKKLDLISTWDYDKLLMQQAMQLPLVFEVNIESMVVLKSPVH